MGLFDFLKSKKKKNEAKEENETAGLAGLDDADLSGLEPPETRYTEEYREFLASMENAERSASPDGDAEAMVDAAAQEEKPPEEPQRTADGPEEADTRR